MSHANTKPDISRKVLMLFPYTQSYNSEFATSHAIPFDRQPRIMLPISKQCDL